MPSRFPACRRAIVQTPTLIRVFYQTAFLVALWPALCDAAQLALTPDHPSGIYQLGETVGWTAGAACEAANEPQRYAYTVKRNNFELIQSGELDLSSGDVRIEVQLNEPAMIYLELRPTGATAHEAKPVVAGAAVAPERLTPVVARPEDFDEFWSAKIQQLKEAPANPVLNSGDAGIPNIEYATIRFDNIDQTHVHGQLARPAGRNKLPAMVIFQWASPPYPLQKEWVTSRAAEGWLALNVEPHDVLPDQPQSYYDELPESLKHYESIGNNDREKSYFLRMYLGDYRALDYVAERPDWDGKTLVVYGISMGGQQGLCLAGLHPKVTHLIVNVPAGCDTNGPLHNRQASYPNFPANDPRIMRTALYFDAVNFAPRIRAHSLVAMGFVDTACAPAGIWTAYNLIPGAKEAVPMPDSPHNHVATAAQQRPFTERSTAWLGALVKGEPIEPIAVTGATRAGSEIELATTDASETVQPIPRIDANSKRAHEQLIEKAKRGGIDLYFVGDSITRRWGCTDPQYEKLLENWRANFFGWNVANFGWGADTTQNILWRLVNGELDGVNPKVIVLLAGTNDAAAMRIDTQSATTITKRLEAVIKTLRRKAPNARLIVTGIFNRGDRPELNTVIAQVNSNLAKIAENQQIHFIDINPKLCGRDGKPREGATIDGLHPTVEGYQLWADELRPLLTSLLGPRASTDHAPPPTGAPSAERAKPK